jgi:hypothetical protein
MKFPLILWPIIASLLVVSKPAQATAINWSNAVNDLLYDSTGAPLTNSFHFEIGIFTDGFVPTASNFTDWAANWSIFDAATLNTDEIPGLGPANFFTSTARVNQNLTSNSPLTSPGSTFPQNTQAYLWAFNSKTVSFTSEWALVTDLSTTLPNAANAWRFPAPENPSLPNIGLEWSLSDAETAIFGSVRNASSVGGGDFTVQPATFSLQTHQVPEPGGALLIASAGLLFMLRRARFISQSR